MSALVLGAVVANRWIAARRGLVIGVLTASAATGQLAFLPLAAWLIGHVGWRCAVVPIVAACLVIAVRALLLIRNRPSDLGQLAAALLAPAGRSAGGGRSGP